MAVLWLLGLPAGAWTPGTSDPDAIAGFSVDSGNRRDVLAFYHTIYPASEAWASHFNWTGDTPTGVAGTTGAAFKDDVRRRINFYRALAGLPADIVFDATKSSKAQEAALMMARNNALDHSPPNTWLSYTANGAEAAAKSNLALGFLGPPGVDAYLRDDGSSNAIVGHRRWLLYPRAQSMGTGDVPADDGYAPANATWVVGDFKPAPVAKFTAWPRGFLPEDLVPARWSLSYPGADFSNATVTMTRGGTGVSLAIQERDSSGLGDNTLVWAPEGLPTQVSDDTTYQVTVSNIAGNGVPSSFSYFVTIFDPVVLGEAITVSGQSSPQTSGASYTFNSIAQADSYQLRIETGETAAWSESAEDNPAPKILDGTSGGFSLRQSSVKRTGKKAFHLAFPDFTDQSFSVLRTIVPSSTSRLRFYDHARFSTTTTTLGAEVSIDEGNTWTSVFSRHGVGLSSEQWDKSFNFRDVSLAAYAGKLTRVRFILRRNGASIVKGTASTEGFFLDDITVTHAMELGDTTVTTLAGNAASFTLDSATAGGALREGVSYFLRLRPQVGTHWFQYGPLKVVTPAAAPTGYALWVQQQYPGVTGGPSADDEGDGIENGLEYAFGLNPLVRDLRTVLPQPARTGTRYEVTFTEPAGVTGLKYGAEWTTNFSTWTAVSDTGTGTTHRFSVNAKNKPQMFFRYKITVGP